MIIKITPHIYVENFSRKYKYVSNADKIVKRDKLAMITFF